MVDTAIRLSTGILVQNDEYEEYIPQEALLCLKRKTIKISYAVGIRNFAFDLYKKFPYDLGVPSKSFIVLIFLHVLRYVMA